MVIQLTMKESSFVSQLIYRINFCDSITDLCKTFFSQIQTVIPYQKGMFISFSTIDGVVSYVDPYYYVTTSDGKKAFDEKKYLNGNYRPIWLEYLASPWSSVFRATDSRDEKEWYNSSLYQEIYLPQGLDYALQVVFVHMDTKLGMIGLYRKFGDQDFSDKEVFFMELLKAHLELKLHRLYSKYHEMRIGSEDMAPVFALSQEYISRYFLTRRETEIINYIILGKTDVEICNELCITKSTFEKHIHNIYRKVSVKNRASLFQKFKN